MDSILDTLAGQLSGGMLRDLSGRLGTDESTTSKAVSAALPLLLGALAKNSSRRDGAASLHHALEKDHDGGILDNLGVLLADPGAAKGDGILGHVLGTRRGTVESGVSRASGMDAQSVGKMLTVLAPVVMGALGRARRENNLDPDGLAGMLHNEAGRARATTNPAVGGLLGLLDEDGDGSVMDDLGKKALGKLFGGK